jgi:PST family polysaccharide transporter
VIGGASLINILIALVRMKFVAVLIGPSGVGLLGVFNSIIGVISTVSAVGLSSSGVRQIAVSRNSGDENGVARTLKTLTRAAWLTGILGLGGMILGCVFLSRVSFGTSSYALSIAVLGVVVLLANITTGQVCVLQGAQRIGDFAKVSIFGALCGTVISIPCYFFLGKEGIVPSLICSAISGLVVSWLFASKVTFKPVVMTWRESWSDIAKLLNFGAPLMLSGVFSMLGTYFIGALLVRQIGLEGVGIWQAAFSISGLLVNFVLGAMGTDYYPRLTAIATDNKRVSEEVNTQTEIAMLLAVPGLAATIILAPLAIQIFYSGKFDSAVDILRWSVYGVFGRVISWPLGFILLAKGKGKTFFCVEAFSNLFYVAAVVFCVRHWGEAGTGIAFLLLYIVVTLVNYAVANVVSETYWTRTIKWYILIFSIILASLGMVNAFVVNPWIRIPFSLTVLVAVCVFSIRRLLKQSGINFRELWSKSHVYLDLTEAKS